jgi:hypothetical protein
MNSGVGEEQCLNERKRRIGPEGSRKRRKDSGDGGEGEVEERRGVKTSWATLEDKGNCDTQGTIKEDELERVQKKYGKDNVGILLGEVDLSPKEEQYCCEKERQAHPELHPPFLFTGENCRPTRMAELLMGEECREFEGGKTVWMKEAYHRVGRAQRYHEISDALKRVFKGNGNTDLFYIKEDKNPAGAAKVRWEAKKHATYYCEPCYHGSGKKDLIAVVRVELKEEVKGENVRCYFDIMECFLHSCKLYKKEGKEMVDNREAVVLKAEGSVFMDEVRNLAFDKWRKELGKIKPGTGDGAVSNIKCRSNQTGSGWYQWRIQKPSDVPPSIDTGKLAQLLAWDLWRILKERNMVDGFTRHIPVSYAVKRKGGKVKIGLWPLEKEVATRVHLYMRGCYLIWGGYSTDEKKTVLEEIELEQICHSSLGAPCSFQTPIEDECEFYTCNCGEQRKHWKLKMNEMLVLGEDIACGGKACIYDNRFHASRHGVVESTSSLQKKEISSRRQMGGAPKFILSREARDMDDTVQRLMFRDLKPLVERIMETKLVYRGKTFEMVEKVKEVFLGDEAEKYQAFSADEEESECVSDGFEDVMSGRRELGKEGKWRTL